MKARFYTDEQKMNLIKLHFFLKDIVESGLLEKIDPQEVELKLCRGRDIYWHISISNYVSGFELPPKHITKTLLHKIQESFDKTRKERQDLILANKIKPIRSRIIG